MSAKEITADEVIRKLNLTPHPEGGYFRETFRDTSGSSKRAHSTAIYYLLKRGERSRWHKVDAAEGWHFYLGAPLLLHMSHDGRDVEDTRLGPDLAVGDLPQAVVPAGSWQAAESLGAFTLVGCTVAPAFEFEGFELAPPGWKPGKS